jgi:hypothetical protein
MMRTMEIIVVRRRKRAIMAIISVKTRVAIMGPKVVTAVKRKIKAITAIISDKIRMAGMAVKVVERKAVAIMEIMAIMASTWVKRRPKGLETMS